MRPKPGQTWAEWLREQQQTETSRRLLSADAVSRENDLRYCRHAEFGRLVRLAHTEGLLSDLLEDDGAPAVTDAMIEAGLYQFLREYPETGTGDELDRRMVAAIYSAMALLAVN